MGHEDPRAAIHKPGTDVTAKAESSKLKAEEQMGNRQQAIGNRKEARVS
jgi:hypothetical protein